VVARALREQGVRIRSLPMMPAEVLQADRLYAQGLSLARIGDQLGYDASTVHRALRVSGVTMRDAHGQRR
jgi:hypothetical protein